MGAFFGLLGILGVYGLYKAIDGIDTARSKARGGFIQEQIHNIAHSGNSRNAKKLANYYRHGGTGTIKFTSHYRGGFTQEQIRNIAHAGNSKNAKRLARLVSLYFTILLGSLATALLVYQFIQTKNLYPIFYVCGLLNLVNLQ